VKTIQEAYPFDETKTVGVNKKERIRGGVGDRVHDWGNVEVVQMVKKLSCTVCGVFILNWQDSQPFRFCRRCRKADRKFQLCLQCFESGAHLAESAQTSVAGSPRGSPRGSPQGSPRDKKKKSSPRGSLAEVTNMRYGNISHLSCGGVNQEPPRSPRASPRGAPKSPCASPRGGDKPPSYIMKSGKWAGTVDETGGSSKRRAEYEFQFDAKGGMSGFGPERSAVVGVVSAFHVRWSEQHTWGTMEVKGTAKSDGQIIATFKASDGGGGKLELKAR